MDFFHKEVAPQYVCYKQTTHKEKAVKQQLKHIMLITDSHVKVVRC